MSKKLNLFVVLFVLLLVNSGVLAFELAPDFKLDTINKETITLSSFRGNKPVLLMFWTTWCPFCVDQLILLETKYSELSKSGLEILAINSGESAYKVERFLKGRKLPYPVLLDTRSFIATSFDLIGVPTYVFIDKDGYIIYRGNRFPKKESEKLLSAERKE